MRALRRDHHRTGAGGGTLAHRLAPSGKRILLLERGGYLPREPENWDSKEVFGKERYLTTDEWIDKNGERSARTLQYFVGGNTKFYGAILFRLRERDFGRSATTAASRPHGRSTTPSSSPTTRRPSGSTSCTARPARTPPSRPLGPIPAPRRLPRAAHPAAPRRPPPAGHHRSTCRSASTSTSPTPRPAAACAATASTASPA